MRTATTDVQVDHPPPVATVSGKPFSVAFDGTVLTGSINIRSTRDFDRYLKVLRAQRAALEAMEEDGNDDEDLNLERDEWLERQAEQGSQGP